MENQDKIESIALWGYIALCILAVSAGLKTGLSTGMVEGFWQGALKGVTCWFFFLIAGVLYLLVVGTLSVKSHYWRVATLSMLLFAVAESAYLLTLYARVMSYEKMDAIMTWVATYGGWASVTITVVMVVLVTTEWLLKKIKFAS